jgi:hypothetical protein
MFKLLFALLFLLDLVVGDDTEPGLALVASSRFRMILSPLTTDVSTDSSSSLDFETLQSLEDAIGTSILLHSQPDGGATRYIDAEVVIQNVQLDDNLSAANIRFFVLATMLNTKNEDDDNKSSLDSIIMATFQDVSGKARFINLLHSESSILATVSQVVVAALVPASNDPTPDPTPRHKLSSLDIILIVISGAIFLGIAWMVFQHHRYVQTH